MTPQTLFLTATSFRLIVGGAMCALYMGLWLIVDVGGRLWNVGGLVDLLFLPAFVRVVGFILIGLWIIPSLFTAFAMLTLVGVMVYPGLSLAEQLTLGLFVASGGPLALALTIRLTNISTDFIDLRVARRSK